MRVSANDVYRMAQRAVDGAGAPSGLDLDAARAAEWLELAGLPGVLALVTDLDARLADPETCRVRAEEPGGITFAGASALLVGAMTIEWAIAQGGGSRSVDGLVSPFGLLPAAADRARECGGIGIVIDAATVALFPRDGNARLAGDWTTLRTRPNRAVVAMESEAERLFATAAGSVSIEAIRDRHLRSGIEIADDIWQRLMRHAVRILVPPSALSRAKGAGSGKIDDND